MGLELERLMQVNAFEDLTEEERRFFGQFFNAFGRMVHTWSRGKGFWKHEQALLDAVAVAHRDDRTTMDELQGRIRVLCDQEKLALINSESGEATEARRKPSAACDKPGLEHISAFEEELADMLIRAFDLAGARTGQLGACVLDKMRYNLGRPHMHGKLA